MLNDFVRILNNLKFTTIKNLGTIFVLSHNAMTNSFKNRIRPKLSKRAFWDVDLDSLDFEQYTQFTIIRVFERGSEEDKKEIMNYYGPSKVRDILTTAPSLQTLAKEWAKMLFHLSDSDFACYRNIPRARN